MDWVIKDEHAVTRIDDSIVSNLKQWLEKERYKVSVTLTHCDPHFWLTEDEVNVLQGACVGATGATGATGAIGASGDVGTNTTIITPECAEKKEVKEVKDERPVAEDKKVVVTISFDMATKYAELLRTHKLNLTENYRHQTLPVFDVDKIYKYVRYSCGIYKRPGFDTAFAAMKTLKPDLTPLTFACTTGDIGSPMNYDTDLVFVKPFCGHDDCLTVLRTGEEIDMGISSVYLSLLAVDVANNFEYLKGLLLGIKSYRDFW